MHPSRIAFTAITMFLLCSMLAAAEISSSPEMEEVGLAIDPNLNEVINETLAYLENHPQDQTTRLNLAFLYMNNNKPLLALREYRTVLEQDKENVDANAGVLWALNMMQAYDLSLKNSKDLLKKRPDQPTYHNNRAYALLKTGNISQARYHYSLGLKHEAWNLVNRQISFEGLGWAYLLMDDYWPAVNNLDKAISINAFEPDLSGLDRLATPRFKTSFGYTVPAGGRRNIALSQDIFYRASYLRLHFEEFQVDSEHFRTALQTKAKYQLRFFNLGFVHTYLTGEDSRVYPANAFSLLLEPKLYFKAFKLVPRIKPSYSVYERFDMQQVDLSPIFSYGKWNLTPTWRYIFQDNDAIDSDQKHQVLAAELSRAIFRGLILGLGYSQGDYDWVIDCHDNVIDTFDASQKNYSAYMYLPLGEYFSLVQFNQLNYTEDGREYLFHIRLELNW